MGSKKKRGEGGGEKEERSGMDGWNRSDLIECFITVL
jgi:hypothetical protein